MNSPLTVNELISQLKELQSQGKGDYSICVARDSEGNGYHACYCGAQAVDTMPLADRRYCNSINESINYIPDKKKIVYLG